MYNSMKVFETQEEWDEAVAQMQAALKRNTGNDNLAEFAAKIIYERIQEHPYAYSEFGFYWFAVKDVLYRHGYYFGDTTDEEIREEFRGISDAHTVVAAERFKDMYRQTYFQGTLQFGLDDGSTWTLTDPEMAARIP